MFSTFTPYVLAFCRVGLVLVFALSFGSKARRMSEFVQTITRFAILPQRLSPLTATLFCTGELAVVALLLRGGAVLIPGFILAITLFLIFSVALVSVLVRGVSTPCNCFGSSDRQVSASDVWRNMGLMLWAATGLGIQLTGSDVPALSVAEWGLVGIVAVVCVATWLQLGPVIRLLQHG